MIANNDVASYCSVIEDIIREIARDEGRDEDEFVREVRRRFNGAARK